MQEAPLAPEFVPDGLAAPLGNVSSHIGSRSGPSLCHKTIEALDGDARVKLQQRLPANVLQELHAVAVQLAPEVEALLPRLAAMDLPELQGLAEQLSAMSASRALPKLAQLLELVHASLYGALPATDAAPQSRPSLARQVSNVVAPGVDEGTELCRDNFEEFVQAVTDKVLKQNLEPYLDIVVREFRLVAGALNPGRLNVHLTSRGKLNVAFGVHRWAAVQRLISGFEINVSSWKSATSYSGSYSEHHPTVQHFWNVLEKRGPMFRTDLLTFWTGYRCMPVGGVQFHLTQASDVRSLPTASTCFATLRLPPYDSEEQTESRLQWAIQEIGFEQE